MIASIHNNWIVIIITVAAINLFLPIKPLKEKILLNMDIINSHLSIIKLKLLTPKSVCKAQKLGIQLTETTRIHAQYCKFCLHIAGKVSTKTSNNF